MKVAVTGGCGFIGKHVCARLRDVGHDVIVLDRVYRDGPVELLFCTPDDVDQCEAVVHLAAHADVRNNWTNGMDTIRDDNIGATLNLLDAMSQVSTIKRVVFTSTGAVYARQMSPYAASKLAGEAYMRAYADRFGWALSTIRPAACYGFGYTHGHIADFVKQAKDSGMVRALTRGDRRDGLHVNDLAERIVACAEGRISLGRDPVYMRGPGKWGCRDTIRMMDVLCEWPENAEGWIGDSAQGGYPVTMGARHLDSGVADALISLGWEVKDGMG